MEMFTWEYLATAAGATACVTIIVQFLKGIPAIDKFPTKLTSYVVSLIVMLTAAYFTCSLTLSNAALIPLNAIIIMFASNGAYSTVSKVTNKQA